MVYHLPKKECFVDFIEFTHLDDIGFDPKGVRTETCSRFAFLTYNKKTRWKQQVNLILIDPFYDDIQISLYKTDKYYFCGKDGGKENDIVHKSVMYSTGREIKMVQ